MSGEHGLVPLSPEDYRLQHECYRTDIKTSSKMGRRQEYLRT